MARRADELLSRPIDQLLQNGLDQVLQDGKIKAHFARAGRQARFRHELLRLLWEYDRGTDETWGELRPEFSRWTSDSRNCMRIPRRSSTAAAAQLPQVSSVPSTLVGKLLSGP